MKTHLHFLFTLFLIGVIFEPQVFAQDPITDYDGIPLVVYPGFRIQEIDSFYQNPHEQMDSMGVFGVVAGDVLDGQYLQDFTDNNLKVIPQYLWGEPGYQYILRYTDAHYTVWEAEGTDPEGGKATLYYNDTLTSYFNDNGIEGRWAGGSSVPDGDTLINGPGYSQNIKYRFFDNAYVNYFAEYQMKITQRDPELPQEYLQDVVCTLLVTATNTTGSTEYHLAEKVLTIADFNGWNNWEEIQVAENGYNFEELPTEYQQSFDIMHQVPLKFNASYIQFKVIWAGLDYVNLYIDKISVYDSTGWALINTPGPNISISALVTTYNNNPTIIGWYGLDEPQSIDNYEPFRVVDEIVGDASENQLRLHTGFTSGYLGTYGQLGKGTHLLYGFEEFWLRAKPKNIQINMYNYHYPDLTPKKYAIS